MAGCINRKKKIPDTVKLWIWKCLWFGFMTMKIQHISVDNTTYQKKKKSIYSSCF